MATGMPDEFLYEQPYPPAQQVHVVHTPAPPRAHEDYFPMVVAGGFVGVLGLFAWAAIVNNREHESLREELGEAKQKIQGYELALQQAWAERAQATPPPTYAAPPVFQPTVFGAPTFGSPFAAPPVMPAVAPVYTAAMPTVPYGSMRAATGYVPATAPATPVSPAASKIASQVEKAITRAIKSGVTKKVATAAMGGV